MAKQIILYILVSSCLMLFGCAAGVEEQSSVDDMGYSSGTVQIECVMVNDQLFQYSDEGWMSDIPKGYKKIGTILQVDNSNYPTENYNAGRLSVGDEIYVDSNSREVKNIYVKCGDGTCAKFVPATIIP